MALLAKDSSWFVEYAQRNFSGVADGYLLSEHAHPHVTLVQFYGVQQDYDAVLELLMLGTEVPQPDINGMLFGFDQTDPGIMWASLTVARELSLVKLNQKLVTFLSSRKGVEIVNEQGDLYSPHITFARIRTNHVPACEKVQVPQVQFDLALGVADALGQFTTVKKVLPEESVSKLQLNGN